MRYAVHLTQKFSCAQAMWSERLGRLKARWRIVRSSGEQLNRRVEIENHLLGCAVGDKPLPDAATCKWLAMRLGTPKSDWRDYHRTPPAQGEASPDHQVLELEEKQAVIEAQRQCIARLRGAIEWTERRLTETGDSDTCNSMLRRAYPENWGAPE